MRASPHGGPGSHEHSYWKVLAGWIVTVPSEYSLGCGADGAEYKGYKLGHAR
jgi:hypothetical protein